MAVNLRFLDRSRYFSIQLAPQLSSRGWLGPGPDPLRLRKSGSAGNRTRDLCICSQELWPLGHRGGLWSGGIAPPFLTLALDGGERSASRSGPRASLEAVAFVPNLSLLIHGLMSFRRVSDERHPCKLYSLSYKESCMNLITTSFPKGKGAKAWSSSFTSN
jgi:hypothetical protein